MKYSLGKWLTITLFIYTIHLDAQSGRPGGAVFSPYHNLESRATAADVTRPETIDALAQEVLSIHHYFRIPDPVVGLLQWRLSNAETAYRNGLGPGVNEAQLLALMTSLGKKFQLPSYSQTTAYQIRHLRMSLLHQSPSFMGRGLSVKELKVGESVEPVMSPLQATHLLLVMADQKIANPDYKDPNLDIEAREQQRVQEFDELRIKRGIPAGKPIGVLSADPRRSEMTRLINAEAEKMSLEDSYELIAQSLTTLGIK